MFTLTTHFEKMLSDLQPPEERAKAAQELPAKVRDYLTGHDEFATVSPHTRLAGSYAQHLTVGDIKDVDILVRVPGDPERNEPDAKTLVADLKKALEGLPEALETEGLTDIDVTGARRSVHVHIAEPDFHIDVVPCIAPDGFEEALWVPDRGWGKWVKSHPIGYIRLLNDLNKDNGEKIKPLIRLFKRFRDFQMLHRKPKSYWLGAMVVQELDRGNLATDKSIGELFHDLVNGVYNHYACLLGREDDATPNLPDPMLGHNVSFNWKRTHFETFMRRLDEARTWAAAAIGAADKDDAIAKWQKVFGEEYFPSDVETEAAAAAKAGLPGSAIVTASGLVGKQKPAVGASVLSRSTRFHGPEA